MFDGVQHWERTTSGCTHLTDTILYSSNTLLPAPQSNIITNKIPPPLGAMCDAHQLKLKETKLG